MVKYVFKRLLFAILALFVLITLIFFLGQLIPGYPFEITSHDTQETINNKLETLGLNDNLIVQYFRFWSNLFTKGQFGENFRTSEPIPKMFMDVMPYTVLISSIAFILGIVIGVTLGIVSAVYKGKWQDTLINILSVFFISVPSFVLATFFIKWASNLYWPIWFPSLGTDGFDPGKMIQASLLPILALTISMAPPLVYYTRNEMVDVLNQEYIKTALSKGMSYSKVVVKHGLRNCLIPIISACLPMFLVVIGGSIIIERFYGVPGIADQLVGAVQKKEIYLLMFNALVISGLYYLISILCDVLYVVIDPRIKLAESNNNSILKITINFLLRNNQNNVYKKWIKKSFYEIEYNSDLFKLVNEKKYINNHKKVISLPIEVCEKYNINESNKYLICFAMKYKLKIMKGDENKNESRNIT